MKGEIQQLRSQLVALREEFLAMLPVVAAPTAPAPAAWAGYPEAWTTPVPPVAAPAPAPQPEAAPLPAEPAPVAEPEPAAEPLAAAPTELVEEANQETEATEEVQATQGEIAEADSAQETESEVTTAHETMEAEEVAAIAAPELIEESIEETQAAAPELVEEPELVAEPELAQPTAAEVLAEAGTDQTVEPEVASELEVAQVEEGELVAESELAQSLVEEVAPMQEEMGEEPTQEELVEEPAQEELVREPAQEPAPIALPEPVPTPAPRPRATPPLPPARPALRPKKIPTGPTFWERTSTVVLENWTGILGAVVLVTGVGFLGIYAALRVSPPLRFLLICAFAAGLLGARFGLRNKDFAKQLNAWLLSSAAAIFLFACVGAVSIPGLRWATPPFDYLLLLAGVLANLYLAWRTSRQDVATLHGVLSLVALAVLPPTPLTLAAAAGVTAFSIAITYRQQWKYQLLLSIASFFAFHVYWHQQLGVVAGSARLVAMLLVTLVGAAAAVVQYRRVYAERRFEPLLFASHLLNWTSLGLNLYFYSTGSIWKTIPLAVGAVLTFWAGRQAKRLGIGWLFQTDTIISLILGLATALSLQGWHATPPVIGLFMLLETLLVTLIMARQREALVYRVALAGALLAGSGLLLFVGGRAAEALPAVLYRDALVLALAGWAGLAFVQFIYKQPLLQLITSKELSLKTEANQTHRNLLSSFAGLAGGLQAGAGLLLARALFGWPGVPVVGLLLALAALAGGAVALAAWVQAAGRAPSWVRRQQLALGQLFMILAIVGLHEVHLSWPVILLLLFAENLGASLLLVRRDALLHRVVLASAQLAGLGLLAVAGSHFGGPRVTLYRDAWLLALAGWGSLAFAQLAFKSFLTQAIDFENINKSAEYDTAKAYHRWVGAFAGLGGLLQLGAGGLVAHALFGWEQPPVARLLGALLALAGTAVALATWVRRGGLAPGWVRWQQLALGQLLVVLAIGGLHELGLIWSALLLVLFTESLLVVLLLAGRDEADRLHELVYRAAMGEALLAGASLLASASKHMVYIQHVTLYREALLLALAGWVGLAFVQLAFRFPLLQGVQPARRLGAAAPLQLVSNPAAHPAWLGSFAGLAGLLQASAGGLLGQALFHWHPAPVGGLLLALLGLAASALGLAAWVRAAGRAPSWVRRQQTVLGQLFVVLAIFGLHELGLSWPGVLSVLYLETLVAALLLARRDGLLHRAALAGALLAGSSLLLLAATHLATSPPAQLYRDAALLALTGWISIAFLQFTAKQLFIKFSTDATPTSGLLTNLLRGFAGLAGLLQVGTGALLARALFGWSGVPVAGLLAALLGLAAGALGLAYWVRASGLAPGWVRRQQLVLAQLFVVLAIFGLHELGLSWPGVLIVLYLETMVAVLLLARRDGLLHRAAMLAALAAGTSLLLLVSNDLRSAVPALLYRDALLVALAGWASIAFMQLTYRQFSPRANAEGAMLPRAALLARLLGGFAGLAGLLQASAGTLLARALFHWHPVPMALLLAALLGLAAAALGLGLWVRASGLVPSWVRRQQLVLTQFFIVLAIVGLHEAHLGWSVVLALLFAETLLAALWLAKRDALLHRAAMAEALLTGAGLLLLAGGHPAATLPPALYRDAALLALAGWAGLAFIQLTYKQVTDKLHLTATADGLANWLATFAGLAGFMQAGAGGLLAQVVFAHADTRALALLPVLAGAALALATWVHRTGGAPRWVRRQQLVLNQAFTILALVGLHETGLSWPVVIGLLYAEGLLAALLLAGRDEEGLLHLQTYLLVLQAGLLPGLVRYVSPGALTPLGQAGLLLGAALLTLGYQLRRLVFITAGEDYAQLPAIGGYRLPMLGIAIGWLLLGAGALEYRQLWAGYAMAGLLGTLLYLRQRLTVPGLWAGLVLATIGYVGLQWAHVLHAAVEQHIGSAQGLGAGHVLLYLLPLVAVLLAGMRTAWWPVGERFVRWPWLYFLGLHLVVMLLGSVPPAHLAYLVLGLLALALAAFAAAQAWRRTLPGAAAVLRAGQPDRYLLHLSYGLLLASLATHLRLYFAPETLLHQPAEYCTAAAIFGGLVALAVARRPATGPVYASWHVLHPTLLEVALLFGTGTLAHHVPAAWLGLAWVVFALIICALMPHLPLRFQRLGVYGRLYFGLAALSAGAFCLRYIGAEQLMGVERWVVGGTVALLFGYSSLALRLGNAPLAGLSPRWRLLAQPSRHQLEAALLYPAFGVLALLFIQSFDRSVLTVLLMLEVVAIFSASLLLRRQDMRYVALAGMAATLVRLAVVDLSRSGTVTRAIVFIFVGLLLLGLHALYARFKTRFAVAGEPAAEEPDELDEQTEFDEPTPAAT
ncbi:hypothetical protein GCM10027422_08530 [Hymenobacter arcticus]